MQIIENIEENHKESLESKNLHNHRQYSWQWLDRRFTDHYSGIHTESANSKP